MSHRFLVPMILVMFLAPSVVAGQAKASAPPRTADGKPDLQGTWSFATITPLERPLELAGKEFFTEQEAADYGNRRTGELNADRRDGGAEADVTRAYNDFWWDRGTKVVVTRRTSLVVDPPNGQIPSLTAAGEKRAVERADARSMHPANGPEDRSLGERCLLLQAGGAPIVPTVYNNNAQLFQTPDHIVIVSEMIHDARIIPINSPLDGRPGLPNNVRQWLGDSNGHWEGDTLVVETTNFTNKTAFRGASENLHLTERFTRVDENTLLYDFTVDDPASFTRPWKVELPLWKNPELIYEYACHEGNSGMAGILTGARTAEKEAAAQKDAK